MADLSSLEIDAFLAQAERLARLAASSDWEVWETLVRDMRLAALERCADPDERQLGYWQGVAAALNEILDRPRRIVAAAADYQRIEEADKKAIRPELRALVGMGADLEGDI